MYLSQVDYGLMYLPRKLAQKRACCQYILSVTYNLTGLTRHLSKKCHAYPP